MFNLIKRHKIITAVICIAIISVVIFFVRKKPVVKGDFVTVTKTNVVQEVDVTGRIEPAEKVALTPESSGKISAVNVAIGDKVQAGEVLVQIDDTDLRIRLQKQQLSVKRAQLALEEAQKGPKDATRLQSENDLERAYEKRFNADSDLKEEIDQGYNVTSDAFLDLPNVLTTLRETLNHSYLSANMLRIRFGQTGEDYRDDAMEKYYGANDVYDDVIKEYRASSRESDQQAVKTLILDTYEATKQLSDAIKVTRNLIDYVERRSDPNSIPTQLEADQTELDALTRTMNTHVSALLAIKNSITTNEQAIADAVRVIGEKDAANRDLVAVDNLDVEKARIDVEQAELDVQDTQDEINKRSIKSPMDGIVTDVIAKRGENISPSVVAVSIISVNNFQVSANLPEIDVAQVKVGMEADVTLDAYGKDVIFPMIVTSINPAESIVEGVAVYKVVLQFVKADDRVKSGLTADIIIKVDHHDDVLAVPQRAVITKNGARYVKVLSVESTVDKPVGTGLRGSDGNIEIISGLTEGDQVLVFSESE